MCPYARFQSAMFDRDTLIISYDAQRGEPRGTRGRSTDLEAANLGHCIDCTLCVQVCPTGIDIRNGLQYECIGCTACIDVCNGVMDKMHYPRGLIRYDTENGLAQHLTRGQRWARVLRPRVVVYGAILLAVCAAFIGSLALRTPFKVDVVRDRASLARIVEDGRIENVYRLQVMNASEQPQRFRIAVRGLDGAGVSGNAEVAVEGAAARWMPVAVQLPPDRARAAGPASSSRSRGSRPKAAAPCNAASVRPSSFRAERRSLHERLVYPLVAPRHGVAGDQRAGRGGGRQHRHAGAGDHASRSGAADRADARRAGTQSRRGQVMRSALQVLWAAFVAAAMLEMLVFAHVDPADVHTLGGAPVELSRQAVYTLSFFGFWAVCAAACALCVWLQQRRA
jgi:ferredoxin